MSLRHILSYKNRAVIWSVQDNLFSTFSTLHEGAPFAGWGVVPNDAFTATDVLGGFVWGICNIEPTNRGGFGTNPAWRSFSSMVSC